MKPMGWLCVAAVVVPSLWIFRGPLLRECRHVENVFDDHLAQNLVGTRFQNSPRVHALLANYADLARYRVTNQMLSQHDAGRVIFYGDSITDFWALNYPAQFFPGAGYVGRGISGQATREMVWRFQQDVIDLHPATVVILAGSNDVILTKRHITYGQTTANLQAMVLAAKRDGLRVILCSLLPISRRRPTEQATYTQKIRAINAWLQNYALQEHLTYLDYFAAMSTASGALNSNVSDDGTHPNAAGYARMQILALQALASR